MSADNGESQPKGIKKGFKQLVSEAKSAVKLYSTGEAIERVGEDDVVFVDVREPAELTANGKIPEPVHAPRGMLEFHIDPESPYFMEQFGDDKEFIFYCAVGGRSALAAQTAQEMGLSNVASVEGGFNAWKQSGGPIDELRPTMIEPESS
jgi:rhodanese-related sulfurtransferase